MGAQLLRPSVRRSWAPKGKTPRIKHYFNWKRLHAVGTIGCNPDGSSPRLHLQVQFTPADAESSVAFLRSLEAEFEAPDVVLWDGLPAHRSKAVKEYIDRQKIWLTVERLPAYAPELNPVEHLRVSMKTTRTANVCDNAMEGLEHASRKLIIATAPSQKRCRRVSKRSAPTVKGQSRLPESQ